MSDGQPRSVSSSHNIIIKTPLPPEPPDGEPPKEALKTPELSSQVSSSILSRQSSANTTPRQNNRRVFEDRNVPTKPSSNSIVADIPAEVLSSHPRHPPLPSPKHHSNCHLLCCFYAEFDIKVGPKICYQSPANFMEQDIRLPVQQMEKLLAKTFHVDSISPEQSPMAGIPKATTSDGQLEKMEDGDDDSPLLSIFDSCSEYIITGNELTGNIISLSTHNIHVLTRPTSIADEKYERNSLLFCVGFVLRRTEDPRPFRPVLSKLALTLRDMEVESQFLSQSRPQIQSLLEGILVSLNSEACECNMLLGKADFLNLKLFRPPKTPARLVKDHEVPILLRQDWQVQAVRVNGLPTRTYSDFGVSPPLHACLLSLNRYRNDVVRLGFID